MARLWCNCAWKNAIVSKILNLELKDQGLSEGAKIIFLKTLIVQ